MEPVTRHTFEAPGDARVPDRDAEVERLKRELRESRDREHAARAEVQEAHKRFERLRTTSKNFAASMRASAAERHRSRRRIAAQYAVARVLAEAGEVEEAAARMLRILVDDLGWAVGVFWSLDEETLRCGDLCPGMEGGRRAFAEACKSTGFRRGEGLPGRAWAAGKPVWVEDYAAEEGFSLREAAGRAGLRSALAFPVRDSGRTSGVFELFGEEAASPDEEMLRVASVIGGHVGQFAERRRAEANAARRRATGILESITDAFVAFDRDWRYTYINPAAADLLRASGRDPEYLLGKVVWDELPEFGGTVFEASVLRAVREGVTVEYEEYYPTLDVWLHARLYPSEDGGVSAYFEDVTERKRAEDALRESEERLRAIADLVPDLLWSNDPSGHTEWYNQRWMEYTGQSPDAARGHGWLDALHPDDRERSRAGFLRAVGTGRPLRQEHRLRRTDGSYRWFLVRAEPMTGEDGGILRWFGAATDVHEHRTALEALRANEEWLGLAQRAARSGTWGWDLESGEIRWSTEHRELFGFDPSDEPIVREEWFAAVHPDDLPRIEKAGRRCSEEGEEWPEIEYRISREGSHDGEGAETRWIHARGRTVKDDKGRPARILGISVDVTERKRAEQERDRLLAQEWVARAEVAERERISRELHDRVAHSMAVVHQSLQLHDVFKGSSPSQAAAKMTLAQDMAKTALESTRNLSMELRRSEAEEGLVPALQDLLRVAVPPGVRAELRTEGDESRVPPHVRGQLFAILREGVRNAVAHSGADHVRVGLDITPDEAVCSVGDDGRGLPEGTGENRKNAEDGGDDAAGVGLRSMRERAGLLGGDFRLSSGPGEGTRVEITVPLNGGR